ncbi:MAG: S8 family serine peptidase [Bacteroidota bacterium]
MRSTINYKVFLLLFFVFGGMVVAQEDAWFFLRAKDTLIEPSFERKGDRLEYTGNDEVLIQLFSDFKVKTFKKTYRNANRTHLKRTFFVIAEEKKLMKHLLLKASHLFEFGELIAEEDKKIFEPNDYGQTSTIGENTGVQANLDYLDFLGVPKAWYYTTGSRDIVVGISDGAIDTTDIEFRGKSKAFRKSGYANGHGMSVAETAAGQGDNGYGIPGICYDCSIYGTSFGDLRRLKELVELSRAGARVINCSWGVARYYETAQQVIYEMLDNGTVIVAAGHNPSLLKTKGTRHYYPASYDKVISVSSGMHRYEDYRENILKTPRKSGDGYLYYARNLRWHVGANVGFVDNDTTEVPVKIYKRSIKNLNSGVDILGPAIGLFRYSSYHKEKNITYGSGATSGVTPLVTGTVGLMFSLNPCLPADEVEGIIKLSATNIDHIEANKPFKGLYGAGMLNIGKAVEMVFKLYADGETAYIENQDFSRWDFKLTSLSEGVHLRNQKFTDSARLRLTAKNKIVIGQNTVLRPDANGAIQLKIDPSLEKQCDLVLRDPAILEKE